jgi:hypothetical protein
MLERLDDAAELREEAGEAVDVEAAELRGRSRGARRRATA